MPCDIHGLTHAQVNHFLNVNLINIPLHLSRKLCPPAPSEQNWQIVHGVSSVYGYVCLENLVCASLSTAHFGRIFDVVDD
jgi:hypothetical protein